MPSPGPYPAFSLPSPGPHPALSQGERGCGRHDAGRARRSGLKKWAKVDRLASTDVQRINGWRSGRTGGPGGREVRADGRSGRIEGPAVETAAAGAVLDRTRGLPSQAGRGECDWAIGLASR